MWESDQCPFDYIHLIIQLNASGTGMLIPNLKITMRISRGEPFNKSAYHFQVTLVGDADMLIKVIVVLVCCRIKLSA